jgi:hypothetical protein
VVDLTFPQVEAILAKGHDIDSEKRTAFRARLTNILRVGLPGYAGLGRGRAAKFGSGQITILALAVELTQLGMPPAQATAFLRAEWGEILAAIIFALEPQPDDNPAVMVLDPLALAPLMNQPARNMLVSTPLRVLQASDLRHALCEMETGRLAVINMKHLIDALADYEPIGRETFLEDLKAWLDVECAKYESMLDKLSGEVTIDGNG